MLQEIPLHHLEQNLVLRLRIGFGLGSVEHDLQGPLKGRKVGWLVPAADDDHVPGGGLALLLRVGLPDDRVGPARHLLQVWLVGLADHEDLTRLKRIYFY